MDNVLLLRFNDHDSDDAIRPVDSVGNLAELVKTGADYPGIVEAELGFGRSFTSSEEDGLEAQDIDSGSTLLTRNASIRVALAWDIAAAAAYGGLGTIYARGKGTSAAEYVSAGLELRLIDETTRVGEVRWIWMDLAGNLKTQIGGHFQAPADGELLITATRRWVSSTSVILRYYLGDALLAELESSDGEIGGGTTGTTTIGTRYDGAAYDHFFDGVIDELQVLDDELSPEEVEATWKRITVEQPRGYQLLQELHDPGFPISKDPASRAQRETRLWGHGLGYAAAQAENVRANILPDRAYGAALSRWEGITKQSPKSSDDVYTRRRRVVGKIRQRLGASPPGVRAALVELLDTIEENLDVYAFTHVTEDDWTDLNTARWRHDPPSAVSESSSLVDIVKSGGVEDVADAETETVETFAGDFYVEFTFDGTIATDIGFNVGMTTTTGGGPFTGWDYALRLLPSSLPAEIAYYEAGVFIGSTAFSGSLADGDVVALERVGTAISLYQNGVLKATFPTASGAALRFAAELYDIASGGIEDLTIEDDGAPAVLTWQNSANVTITDSPTLDEREWSAAGELVGALEGAAYPHTDWMSSLMSVQADGRDASIFAKLDPTTIDTQGEAGLVFWDRASNNAFLFGLRNDAGTYRLVTQSLIGGILGAATNRAAPGLVTVWLRLWHDDESGNMRIQWSTTAEDGPFTTVEGIAAGFDSFQWAGHYVRTFSNTDASVEVAFDDTIVRQPYSDRPFRFYVLRDDADPGNPDYLGANATLRGLKQAQTQAYAVRTLEALYDDISTGYDGEPMGGI